MRREERALEREFVGSETLTLAEVLCRGNRYWTSGRVDYGEQLLASL